jgi:Tfp pilus assembly protein PilP
MKMTNEACPGRARRTVLRLICAMPPALLAACSPAPGENPASADVQDLQRWLATTRRHIAAALPSHTPVTAGSQRPVSTQRHAGQPVTERDPFAPPERQAAAGAGPDAARTERVAEPAPLRMLGTIRDGNVAYALIGAGKQVFCVAAHATLPSYPATVAAIAEHAVELDRMLPGGGHRRVTLRLGE